MIRQATLPGNSIKSHLEQAKPFLKWAGGKRSLVPEIFQRLPATINLYWEPFVGGGAVFFALNSRIHAARLSDVNSELALTYRVVKDNPEGLIERLSVHADRHAEKEYYYAVRRKTGSRSSVEVAARLIYLNKTGFNGLYRVNKKGEFNVPRGSYKNPAICDADVIRAASSALQKATLTFQDFEHVEPGLGDFIYCDPPYDGTFTDYAMGGFSDNDQLRLRDAAVKWHRTGASVMISNADTPLIRNLYSVSPFVFHEVSAKRQINCKDDGRGAYSELLITTYDAAAS